MGGELTLSLNTDGGYWQNLDTVGTNISSAPTSWKTSSTNGDTRTIETEATAANTAKLDQVNGSTLTYAFAYNSNGIWNELDGVADNTYAQTFRWYGTLLETDDQYSGYFVIDGSPGTARYRLFEYTVGASSSVTINSMINKIKAKWSSVTEKELTYSSGVGVNFADVWKPFYDFAGWEYTFDAGWDATTVDKLMELEDTGDVWSDTSSYDGLLQKLFSWETSDPSSDDYFAYTETSYNQENSSLAKDYTYQWNANWNDVYTEYGAGVTYDTDVYSPHDGE